jgi:hypothetical protein
MIQIDDYDLPIQVAEKIISGTKEVTLTPMVKAIRKAVTGVDEGDKTTEDMFSIEENEEIASYLMVYVNGHKNGD